MIVIGLSAKMGCGKSTLAKMLVKELDPIFTRRVAFGDLLKRECSAHFGFPAEWCYSQEGKEKEFVITDQWQFLHGDLPLCAKPTIEGPVMTVREALQWYGTDYRRAQDPEYWTKAMRKELVLAAENQFKYVVVDDVRFPNEAQVCLDNGFCFRIEPFQYWKPGPHAGHASETALDGYDKFTEWFMPGFGLDELSLVAKRIVGRVRK